MPGEVKPAQAPQLQAHAEKPNHYTYLKEFRVDPCKLFKQHQCTQHRPYTCFYSHFANQRRRRPVRRKDGYFNYSPDIYCNDYDENTGICKSGEEPRNRTTHGTYAAQAPSYVGVEPLSYVSASVV